jgi:excisionase family DNA binding protein
MTTAHHPAQTAHKPKTKFFTVDGIALQLNVSARTVHRWIANRQLVVHRIGRSVRISDADLKSFLAIHRDEG